MSILTPKQAWYRQNRERVIEKAREWRLAHPERYRELQRNAKRLKRKQLSPKTAPKLVVEAPKPTVLFIFAPGYDAFVHGDYEWWCKLKGIDPKKSWTEETDEFFG